MLLPLKTGSQAGLNARPLAVGSSRKANGLRATTARIRIVSAMLSRFSDVKSIYVMRSCRTDEGVKYRIAINKSAATSLFGPLALKILPEPEEGDLFEKEDFVERKKAWMADVKSCLERLLADLEGEKGIIENRFWN